jgi:hypothetical protein
LQAGTHGATDLHRSVTKSRKHGICAMLHGDTVLPIITCRGAFRLRSCDIIFARNGEWLQVTRITGPTHNHSAIVLGKTGVNPQAELARLRIDDGKREAISAARMEHEVMRGVAQANAELGTRYSVSRIRFVPTDGGAEGVYLSLARALVTWFAQQDQGSRKVVRAASA